MSEAQLISWLCWREKGSPKTRVLLSMPVSIRTIDRILRNEGLFGRVAKHKYPFTPEHIRKRLSFVNGYSWMTEADWEKVVFSDEKTFWGHGFCGQVFCRRPVGETLNPRYTVPSIPHPVKIGCWACFSARGVGYCYLFNETMDGALMAHIVSTHVRSSAEDLMEFRPEEWWLLHDNDKKFGSDVVKRVIHNQAIKLLDFPPYSPDLNPIENLWNDLARRVEKRPARNWEELQDIVAEEWEKTDKELMRRLARSMPQRMQAVKHVEGWYVDF
jgi:hypothetical protein